ncbi:uncharacterized protein LOC122247099 [Penaeus japonicus]|uniref:uncharacterized protein LOC122247099 n=1 Tax=Penaeus japonicus TaxID=27405 RepID=UPI001C7102F4|nr:uncharacterized protein LOC122247099 [Penaeus japonicus]
MSFSESMVVQKGSPIQHAINHRLAELNKSGIFKKWKRDASPPVKVCSRSPEEILVKDKLKYNSIRGMLLVLASGLIAGLIVFCLELGVARITSHSQVAPEYPVEQ